MVLCDLCKTQGRKYTLSILLRCSAGKLFVGKGVFDGSGTIGLFRRTITH
jgi:hypothetical protein